MANSKPFRTKCDGCGVVVEHKKLTAYGAAVSQMRQGWQVEVTPEGVKTFCPPCHREKYSWWNRLAQWAGNLTTRSDDDGSE